MKMTAYELANTILKTTDMQVYAQSVTKATNMLRQQADRIAELEKENTDLVFRAVYAEKTMHMIQRHYDQLEAQTKPLSDEEIFNLTTWKKNPYELYVEMEKEDMIAFARAIEERHGIK